MKLLFEIKERYTCRYTIFFKNYLNKSVTLVNMVGSSGLMILEPACRSRGRWFEAWAISFCLSEQAIKAVDPFHLPGEVKIPRREMEKTCNGLTLEKDTLK